MNGITRLMYHATLAEGEGIGTWYEYLAKRRIYKKIQTEVNIIYVDSLPEKYGLGLDLLFWTNKKIYISDARENKITEIKRVVNKLKITNPEIIFFSPKTKVDLIVNTEVLQNFNGNELTSYIKHAANKTSKYILLFIPNQKCYAHPKISGLNSKSLLPMTKLIKNHKNLIIADSGYIDIPPWPAGMSIQSKAKDIQPTVIKLLFAKFLNQFAQILIPILVKLEVYYPLFIQKHNAHMIYFLLKKN